MTDRDDSSAQQPDPTEVTAPQPTPPTAAPAEASTQETLDFGAAQSEPIAPAPAETAPELPDDLQAVQASLEQPTGEIAAIAAALDAEPEPDSDPAEPSTAEILDQIAPGTIVAETPADQPEAEAAEAVPAAEPQAGEAAEPTAEVAEGESAEPAAAVEGESAEVAVEPGEGAEVAAEPGEGAEAAAVAEQPAEGAEVPEEELAVAPKRTVPWWPFIVYDLVWLAVAGYAVWKLQTPPAGLAPYETDLYSTSMLVGLSLLAAGPALLLIVWLVSVLGNKNRKIGSMFISALIKGATATLVGAVIWLGALMLIDYLRLGRPF